MAQDLYSVLGVSRSATQDEIKRAYRALARKLHPDVNKSPDAADKFAKVQEAYDVLSDEQKRSYYDQFGHAPGSNSGTTGDESRVRWGGSRGSGSRVKVDSFDFDAEDLGSMFDTFFGGHGRSGVGGGRGTGDGMEGDSPFAGSGRAARPRQVEQELLISFITSVKGGTEPVRLSIDSGPDAGKTRSIEVTIPPGILPGSQLRIRGAGSGNSGGSNVDLLLTIRVGEHPQFRRTEHPGLVIPERFKFDLFTDVPISITDATLGGTVTVPTLDGSVELTIPPGTASGSKLRLKGRGITPPPPKSGAASPPGDLYAIIKIVPPKLRDLSPQQIAALESLR